MERQPGLHVGVLDRDRQDCHSEIGDGLCRPLAIGLRQLQLLQSDLDRQLPQGSRTEQQVVVSVPQFRSRTCTELARIIHGPDQSVAVKE